MFDGVVDMGVEHVNGMGKQRSVLNLDSLYLDLIGYPINIRLKRIKVDIPIGNQTGMSRKI